MLGGHLLGAGFRLLSAIREKKVALHARLLAKHPVESERGTCADTGKEEEQRQQVEGDEVMGGGVRGPGPPGGSRWGGFHSRSCSSCFRLCSSLQFQLLQAGGGVPGSVRGLQAPAEPKDRREPHLARRARPESGGRPDGEAAAAARNGGPAGTDQTRLDQSHDTIQTEFVLMH